MLLSFSTMGHKKSTCTIHSALTVRYAQAQHEARWRVLCLRPYYYSAKRKLRNVRDNLNGADVAASPRNRDRSIYLH